MNLCGTVNATEEPELVIVKTSSDNDNRSNNSPKTTPQRVYRGNSLMDQTPASVMTCSTPNTPDTPLLNSFSSSTDVPGCHIPGSTLISPLAKLQTANSLMKKLETGYHMKQLVETTQDVQMSETILLTVDSSGRSLRIRPNSEDKVRTGTETSSSEASIALDDISHLETGIQKSAMSLMNMKGIHPIRCFTIYMKEIDGKKEEYHFETFSMNERDSIIAGIQELRKEISIDTDLPIDAQETTLSPMKRTHIHSGTAASLKNSTEESCTATPRTPFEQGTETSLAAFSFDRINSGESNGADEEENSDQYIALPSLNDATDVPLSPPTLSQRTTSAELPTDLLLPSRSRTLSDIKEYTLADGESVSTQSCSEPGASREYRNENDKLAAGKEDEREATTSSVGSTAPVEDEEQQKDDTAADLETNKDPLTVNLQSNQESDEQVMKTQFALSTEVQDEDTDGADRDSGDNLYMMNPWCTDDLCTATLNDFWAGIFGTAQHPEQKVVHEGVISGSYGILSGPTAIANFLSTGDVHEKVPMQKETSRFANRIQSQTSRKKCQVSRVQQLRAKMTFEADKAHNKMQFQQTVNSFDDAERTGRKSTYQFDMTSSTGRFDMFNVGNFFTSEPDETVDDEMLYYDSDPEHYRSSRLRKGPRRVSAEEVEDFKATKRTRRRVLSGIPLDPLAFEHKPHRMDERVTAEVIEAMKNEKMTLIWHPTQTREASNRPPVCVKVWIETGVYLLDGSFLLPKLTWIPLHEGDLQTKVLNVGKECPERLDLLDVCRVRECANVDRTQHPFARADRSFSIHTPDEVFLFEAQCSEERNRIVNGLKLVIARLASLLMMRDVRAVDEFFGGGAVPGEAPVWAQQQRSETTEAPGFP